MDNFRIDVTAEGSESLAKAVGIAFAHNAPGLKVESYSVTKLAVTPYNDLPKGLDGRTALVLRWTRAKSDKGAVDLPFKLDAAGAVDFVMRWLEEQDLGSEPDHDGDNGRGWRLFTGPWGHVGDDHYAVFAIVPAWAMYGK